MIKFEPAVNRRYYVYGAIFQFICLITNVAALVILVHLLLSITASGIPHLTTDFLTNPPSRFPEKSGVFPAIMGTIWNMSLTGFFAIGMGMTAAIYLEEYSSHSNRFVQFIKINIQNLAGVPSIIYGILGLTLFVRWMGLGRSVIAGALTMALLILPTITIATQEALRAVPDSFRFGGYGIGMTRWQVVKYQVLPVAMPGILTGVIIGLSRAIGETAPLIMIGALTYVAFAPSSIMDGFTVLPIQIFNWASLPQKGFHDISAAAIIILLAVLLSMNAVAIYLRVFFQRKLSSLHG
ncbi:phosphate ABC transporter permease PstA [Leptonema illini]|jgi:phosphate transport system permease protein|uniref:Phosphate transport system permease protein PstA n=1 Tax=Leptonema illini DSM 21528 TaxID=929563 RepID=H2CEI3_9LEPT|nr:phosphate ABC transporter permease PstA [Leptonema illini]EHQ05569.1 phosphate ABC transporter membrane protein 2, PhoT family [Leptonema illini DSM 21528]